MDITNISNKPVDFSRPKTGGVENLAEPKGNSPTDRDGDRDNSIGQDNTSFTADALRLSSSSVVSGVNNQTRIPDRDQAEGVMSEVVKAIRANPDQTKQALANISPANAARLLTEQVVAA